MHLAVYALMVMSVVTSTPQAQAESAGLPPVPGIAESRHFRVRIADKEAFVGAERSNGRVIATCFLEISGPARLEVTLPCPADKARPASVAVRR